jgi:5-formyltetrahydrofolate cyclo-ligase
MMDAQALQTWRTGMRAELVARRRAMPDEDRARAGLAISLHLLRVLPAEPGMLLGFCWPYRGEYDARRLLRTLRAQGVDNALPVIHGKAQPLRFRRWWPGVRMERGPMGIPAPVDGPEVAPDVLLIPLVGFGRAGDRLGYGGGYFDRTLTSLVPQPLAIGVGYEMAQLESTFPQAHDIPMDAIVTEAGVRMREGGMVQPVDAARARAELTEIAAMRLAEARSATTCVPTNFGLHLP